MGERKWIWIGLAAVAFGFAVIPPVLFGQPRAIQGQEGGDPWRNILFDFQTLITGLAAVTAAAWTVTVMEKTDARQEKRHRELIDLSLRADRLKIERMLYPQVGELQDIYDNLSEACRLLKGISPDEVRGTFDVRFRPYIVSVRSLQQIFKRAVWIDAQPLFGGELAAKVGELEATIEQFFVAIADARNAEGRLHGWGQTEQMEKPFDDTPMAKVQYEIFDDNWKRWTSTIRGVEAQANFAAARLKSLFPELSALAKEYNMAWRFR